MGAYLFFKNKTSADFNRKTACAEKQTTKPPVVSKQVCVHVYAVQGEYKLNVVVDKKSLQSTCFPVPQSSIHAAMNAK